MALETKRNCSRDTTFCSSLVNPRFLFFPHSAEKYFFCFAFFFFSSLFLSPHSLPILTIASAGWVLSSAAVPARECQMSRHARDEKERWLPDARGRKTTFSASSKRRMLYRSGSGWLVGWCFRSFVVCAVISFTTVCCSLLRHPHSFTTMHLKSTGGGRVSPDVGFQGFFFLALFFYSFSPLFFNEPVAKPKAIPAWWIGKDGQFFALVSLWHSSDTEERSLLSPPQVCCSLRVQRPPSWKPAGLFHFSGVCHSTGWLACVEKERGETRRTREVEEAPPLAGTHDKQGKKKLQKNFYYNFYFASRFVFSSAVPISNLW